MAKRKKPKSKSLTKRRTHSLIPAARPLLKDLRAMILETRERVSQAVNAGLVLLYWEVGHRIHKEVLESTRAAYGEEIVATVSRQLTNEFGRGYSEKALWRMVQFSQHFEDRSIVATLSRQLSWSHFVEIIPMEDPLMREFYTELCRMEYWSVRTLRSKIQGLMFERTALSKKPDKLIKKELTLLREKGRVSPDLVFRDPYILDFLGLKDTYEEKDLEAAILRELERFVLELGSGFTFVDRQKRIIIDGESFYLDLLFYHRRLRRLIAIDLKIGKFTAADKGQMELYLRWLEKYEREPSEETPLGLILCAGKSDEQVELLQLDKSGIRVATFLTELPSRALLHKKLKQAIALARAQLMSRN